MAYAKLSASPDLQKAIACQGDSLLSCKPIEADQQAYVNGAATKATGAAFWGSARPL